MIDVGILGATGTVGQKFISLLREHPQFIIQELVASERSAGKLYKDACTWKQNHPIPSNIANLQVKQLNGPLQSKILFSGLDSSVAYEAEKYYAEQGHIVISNSKNHRMEPLVPLVIPEINYHHLNAIKAQEYKGAIITNPNCSTMGLSLALAPLHRLFGISKLIVTTMQAISGGGYPGVPSLDILGNVVPFIGDEEEKIETETQKILGDFTIEHGFSPAKIDISAHCNRVPVLDGHTETVSVKFINTPNKDELLVALCNFKSFPQEHKLHTAPQQPIIYYEEDNRPQPILDIYADKGMATHVGRLRPCHVLDYKFVVLSHNTIRGAAGAAILNAEALIAMGLI